MIIINPFKPLYKDLDNKIIRMGNFEDNAKEIEYEDESLLFLIENAQQPISRFDLIKKVKTKFNLSDIDINEAIDYLMTEGFFINYNEYQNLLKNLNLNRQNLFFSMASECTHDWSLKVQPNILLLGLGGVGANVALLLSRSGFNNFSLVDFDKVEQSNLMRQLPYDYNDIGQYKTETLKRKIEKYSNSVKIVNKKVEKKTDIESEIMQADFVICTLDKPSRIIRRLINDLCIQYNKPVIFAGFAEHVAMIGPFIIPGKSACLNCIEKKMTEVPMNNVREVPSYGPLCLLISSIISNEIINYYFNFNCNNLIGKTMMFNILSYNVQIINWDKKQDCKRCGNGSK